MPLIPYDEQDIPGAVPNDGFFEGEAVLSHKRPCDMNGFVEEGDHHIAILPLEGRTPFNLIVTPLKGE